MGFKGSHPTYVMGSSTLPSVWSSILFSSKDFRRPYYLCVIFSRSTRLLTSSYLEEFSWRHLFCLEHKPAIKSSRANSEIWHVQLIRGTAGSPPSQALPPIQEYIECAEKRRQTILFRFQDQYYLGNSLKQNQDKAW